MRKWASWFQKNKIEREILSPNGQISCRFIIDSGKILYTVSKNDKLIIKPSELGFLIFGESPLRDNFKLIREQKKGHREKIELIWGEDKYIENNYNESAFYLAEEKNPRRIMTLRFRVFNDSVAFRYEIPPQPKFRQITVKDELTEFKLDLNAVAWKIPAYQPDRYEYNYEKAMIGELKDSVHTPLTLKTPNGFYLSIHEAALYNYGSATIKLNKSGALKTDITPLSDGTKAHLRLPFQTPWRLIMISDSAIGLTLNRTMLCLNEPPENDFSWVETLKFIGIWWAMYVGEWTWAPGENHGATTTHAREYIDSAVRLGVSGLLIEGWNDGWEGNWLENGGENKFTVTTPDFNLEEVSRYAKKRNIEIVGHHETVGYIDNYENQLEPAYNYYSLNGIRYIKSGYAGPMMIINGRREYHHSQLGVNHYQKTVELSAKKHICLDIHEPIKGTGIERTWPNLLSREGARGQEYEGGPIGPTHACILPFTRLLSGGMDYTSGIFDLDNEKKPVLTTLARQLAYFIVIYSGMQMIADRPFIYEERFPAEFNFIRQVPTNFERTLPLAGEIGEYYIVARKDHDSSDWYIGGVTNEDSRRIHIDLDFIENGTYEAEIFMDSEDAHYQNNKFGINSYKKQIDKNDSLDLFMAPGGGFAVRLKKIKS